MKSSLFNPDIQSHKKQTNIRMFWIELWTFLLWGHSAKHRAAVLPFFFFFFFFLTVIAHITKGLNSVLQTWGLSKQNTASVLWQVPFVYLNSSFYLKLESSKC